MHSMLFFISGRVNSKAATVMTFLPQQPIIAQIAINTCHILRDIKPNQPANIQPIINSHLHQVMIAAYKHANCFNIVPKFQMQVLVLLLHQH